MDVGTALGIGALLVALVSLLFSRRDRNDTSVAEIAAMKERLNAIEKNADGLREWKHLTVDPYIPRAVDDHHRRLEHIERRIFNGHER